MCQLTFAGEAVAELDYLPLPRCKCGDCTADLYSFLACRKLLADAFLSRIEQLRKKGDYNCVYSVSEDEISSMIEPAKELIIKIEELIEL